MRNRTSAFLKYSVIRGCIHFFCTLLGPTRGQLVGLAGGKRPDRFARADLRNRSRRRHDNKPGHEFCFFGRHEGVSETKAREKSSFQVIQRQDSGRVVLMIIFLRRLSPVPKVAV